MFEKNDPQQTLVVLNADECDAVSGGMIMQQEEARPKPRHKPETHFWYGGTIADAGL
jgi:hypothetical protein